MKLKTIFIAVLFFVGSAASALAQMATVKGTLKDSTRSLLPDVPEKL